MYRTLLIALLALPLAQLVAQDNYLIEALRANPEISAAYQAYLAASERGTQVRALDEPVLSYSEFLTSVQTRTGPQERIFAISQSFPWPGVLKLRQSVADGRASIAFYHYETTRRDIIERVGLAEIEYAYLKHATDRASENLNLLRQIKPVVEEKVRAGGSLATSLRIDVELAVADQEVDTLRDQRPGLDAQLKVILGRAPDSPVLPWSALPSQPPALMPLDHLKAQIRAHHPRIRMAAATVEAARRTEVLAEKNNRPAFTLGANAIDIGNGGETASSVMLGVKLPIRREKYRAERDEATALTNAAGATLDATDQVLVARGIQLHAAQQEAMSRLINYRDKLIPTATQAVDLTKEDFRNDKASLTDLIESERILLDLQLMQVRALADTHKAAWQIRSLSEPITTIDK